VVKQSHPQQSEREEYKFEGDTSDGHSLSLTN
jgi:hypothetical protein